MKQPQQAKSVDVSQAAFQSNSSLTEQIVPRPRYFYSAGLELGPGLL